MARWIPKHINETMECDVEGCTNRRYSQSRICPKHAHRLTLFGSFHGRVVREREYVDYCREAARLVALNSATDKTPAHPALALYRNWFKTWILSACEAPFGGVQMAHVVRESEPEEADDYLIRIAGLWIWHENFPLDNRIIDEKSFTYHAGRELCRMRQRDTKDKRNWRSCPAIERRNGALYIGLNTIRLLKAFAEALRAEEEARKRMDKALEETPLLHRGLI